MWVCQLPEMKKLNIPVGISDFEKIRNGGFYYIDKSGLITEILDEKAEVTLITRPRRFGKTLGMSMLESFFDIRKDSKELFDGLEIAEHQALCDEWMNQYPTVFVSFRQVDGLNFAGAYDMLTWVISELYKKHLYLLDSDKIDNTDKDIAKQLVRGDASLKDTKGSLLLLTRMMQQHYGKPVILLIDEYDVPVAKANNNGYYAEMLDVMKGLMQALKDNQALQFAVVTGCSSKKSGQAITYNLEEEPVTLDPQIADDYSSRIVIMALYEGLTRLDENNQVSPGVAQRWESNSTYTSFTFYLREDASWSDGTPVTASDFVYAFQRAVDPATGSTTNAPMFAIKNAKKQKKVVDKPFKGWYYSQRRRKQHRHNKNNSETIMRIVAITKTIQNH